MVMLVTLEEAQLHLRIDSDDDSADVTLKIAAASAAVINYLKSASPYTPEIDSSGIAALDSFGDIIYALDSAGELIPLPEVQQAVLYLLGDFYRDRDGQEKKDWQLGYLPMPVTALLYPLRTPALA